MKKIVKIIVILTIGFILSLTIAISYKSYALSKQPNNYEIKFEKTYREDLNQKMGITSPISISEYIVINNEIIPLYCTFENPSQALKEIKLNIPYITSTFYKKYDMIELSQENMEDYENTSLTYSLEHKKDTIFENEYKKLKSFLNIYKNTNRNTEIKEHYNDMTNKNEIDDFLYFTLPNYTPQLQQKNQEMLNISNRTSMLRSYSLQNGITYAEMYATSPYTDAYGYLNADCTNFTSQILEAMRSTTRCL